MKQNPQKTLKIILTIIIALFLFRGLIKLLPLLIILGFGWWVWRKTQGRAPSLNQFFAKKNNMIDHDTIKNTPNPKQIKKLVQIAGALILIIIILSLIITVVPAGNVGIMDFFGRVGDRELSPGIQFKTPLSRVITFSTRTQEFTMTSRLGEGNVYGDDSITALTKEGLTLGLDITVLYKLESGDIADLYKNVGQDFKSKIIRPSIRTTIRDIVAQYNAVDLYSDKREEAVAKLSEKLKSRLANRGITIEDVLLRNVTLPDKLADAIEEKLKAEQEAQRFDFILEKETKEAERKRIEASGQRDAQKIINESLTTRYLEYLYIRELKDREGTIYVPINPSNGLPLFRGL